MSQYKKILVTLDGSLLAERALEPAVTLAKAVDAELMLLRVITPVYLWAPFMEIEPTFEIAQQRNQEETAAYLDEVRAKLLARDDSLTISTVVLDGPVAEAIVDYALTHGVDLIVMSSHGRSGIGRWVYGSVAEKVLRGVRHCSILVVRGDVNEEVQEEGHTSERAAPVAQM